MRRDEGTKELQAIYSHPVCCRIQGKSLEIQKDIAYLCPMHSLLVVAAEILGAIFLPKKVLYNKSDFLLPYSPKVRLLVAEESWCCAI